MELIDVTDTLVFEDEPSIFDEDTTLDLIDSLKDSDTLSSSTDEIDFNHEGFLPEVLIIRGQFLKDNEISYCGNSLGYLSYTIRRIQIII